MPQIVVVKPFDWYHKGHELRTYAPAAEPVDADEDCATVAVREGWATVPSQDKAAPRAPQNKDAAPRRITKAAA